MKISAKIFSGYGDNLSIKDGETEKAVRGFLSPMDSKNAKIHRRAFPAGYSDDARLFVLLPADALFDDAPGKTLIHGSESYELLSATPVYFLGELDHWEGILRLKEAPENA